MALKAGYKGIKKCGPGLKYDNLTGTLKLDGESDLTLDNLKDVVIDTPVDGDVLMYDSSNEDWYNEQPDSTPTEDSANLVTSGGVYAAIEDVDVTDLVPEGASSSNKLATASDVNDLWSANAVLGAKNFCESRLLTGETRGITATRNADGSYTLSGTNDGTGNSTIRIDQSTANGSDNLKNYHGNYTLSLLDANGEYVSKTGIIVMQDTTWATLLAAGESNYGTVTGSIDKDNCFIYILVLSGTDFTTPKTVYPMLRLASDTDSTYAPYAMTNGELTEAVTPIITEVTAADTGTVADLTFGDADFKKIIKIGNIVHFNIRFTLNTATTTSDTGLFKTGYPPLAKYPLFSLRSRNAPYEEVAGVYMTDYGIVNSYGIALQPETYWIYGEYVCK